MTRKPLRIKVMEKASKLIYFAVCYIFFIFTDFYLSNMMVEQLTNGYRLSNHVFSLNYIKNTGVNNFFISCHKYNFNAQKFYKKMGGKIIKIDEDSDNNGLPQIKFEYKI